MYVFVDGGAGVAPGEPCRLVVEALEEKRRFACVTGRHGPKVYLSESALRGLGVPTKEGCVVELRVRKAEEAAVRREYARWDPELGFTELQVGNMGFVVGEELEVVDGRRYGVEAFVEDFRAHRMWELANVELGVEDGTLTAAVDGERVLVQRHRLAAHGLKAVLKMELGRDQRLVKVVFDGSVVEARFGNSDPILEWATSGGRMDVRYSRGAGQAYVMRMTRVGKCLPEGLDSFEEGLTVVSNLAGPIGLHTFEATDVLRERLRSKLNATRTSDEYKTVRGQLAENLARFVSPRLGLEILEDHPFAKRIGAGCRRPGPDFLVQADVDVTPMFLEVKWWENVVQSASQAREQVRASLKKHLGPKPALGAYILIIDWKITKLGRIYVERVS